MQRSQNFNSNRGGFRGGRGGFQNRRDQGENGDFGRRGGRGSSRGGKIYKNLYCYIRFLLIKVDLMMVVVVIEIVMRLN
jgi:hypothetical protein